jgi:glycogen operon protein
MDRGAEHGSSYPLGASMLEDGVNFSIYSRDATALSLLLYDVPAASRPSRVIELDPKRNRTYHYWHVFVPGLKPGQFMPLPRTIVPESGLRFDSSSAA